MNLIRAGFGLGEPQQPSARESPFPANPESLGTGRVQSGNQNVNYVLLGAQDASPLLYGQGGARGRM